MKFYIDTIENVKEIHDKMFLIMLEREDYDNMGKYLQIKYHNGLGRGCIAIPDIYVDIISIDQNLFDSDIDWGNLQ